MIKKVISYSALIVLLAVFSVDTAFAADVQNGFSGEAIRLSRDSIFDYMEGSFGAFLLVCAGFGTILSASMGMYSQSKVLLIAALGIFSVRSMTVTFFPDQADKAAVVDEGGAAPGPKAGANSAGPKSESTPEPEPTAALSKSPEPEPTAPAQPSAKPSIFSTSVPSKVPTSKPTQAPTKAATQAPTKVPTAAPTTPPKPTATSKPAPTPAPTAAPKKCTGGRMCLITGTSCHCSSRLPQDDPTCTNIGDIPCRFG